MPTLRWQPIATLLLSIAGLGVSIYLTITHFDKVALVCSDNGTINCDKVTTSPQSEIFGIPVAMLGPGLLRPDDRPVPAGRLAHRPTGGSTWPGSSCRSPGWG